MAIVAYLRKHKYDRRLALVFGKEVIDHHGDSVMTVLDENNNKGGQLQFVRPHQTVADKKELETNKLTLSPTKNHKKTIKNNNDDGDESEGDEHDEGESRDVMPSPTKKGGRPTILRQSSSFSDGKSVCGDDDDNESCASEQHGGKRPSLRKQVSFSEGDVSEMKEIDCVDEATKGDLYYTKTEIEQFKEDKQGEQLEDRKQKAKSEKEKYEEDKAEHEREVSRMAKKLEDESRKKQEAWEKQQAEVERMEKMMRDQLSAMYSLSLSNK